jgi:cytochrome P450 family 6
MIISDYTTFARNSNKNFPLLTETLRLYGPVPQLIRTASRDYQIPNTNITIPEGTLTMIPVYAIHHDPDIYPEPEKFDPERFSDENKKDRHSMAYIPFGKLCDSIRVGKEVS